MIFELLSVGKKNAKTSKEIATALDIDVREVRQVVRNERIIGKAICSCSGGYYLPAEDQDIKQTVCRLYGQADANKRVADAMSKLLKKGV